MTTTSLLAPAKINLYLHVTGKRADGYHLLDSLVSFADIGDMLSIAPATCFSFHVKGPYAPNFTAQDLDPSLSSGNLVVKAVRALSEITGRTPAFKITLTKNIPLESGLGGGSSDAATCLRGLMKLWNITPDAPFLNELMLNLGADVPVCLSCKSAYMRGIGEEISPLTHMPEIPILLVWPGKGHSTKSIFKHYTAAYKSGIAAPKGFDTTDMLIDFLSKTGNDLYEAASHITPDIKQVLDLLNRQDGALLSRMSGSGTSSFALFKNEKTAKTAAQNILQSHPEWWIRTGWLNQPVCN